MKTILYIEDKVHVRENFIRMMDRTGFFKVLSASKALEAIDLVEKIRVDIVIIGRQITAREVDVLDHYLKQHNDIKLIAMTGRKSPLANILKAFEYKIQFETPLDIGLFVETLLSEFEVDSGGQIRGISIAAFMQMIELEGKTCTINVMANGKRGTIYCDGGNLIDAEIGDMKGNDAAYEILGMENTFIEMEHNLPDREKTINTSLMRLLLESGRRKDECGPKRIENRRYRRFECDLPVNFFYGEGSYTGRITNISLNGLFIETKGPFVVGKEINIALYSVTMDRGCRMDGVIVRKEDNGMGITFPLSGINHMAILRTIIHEVQHIQGELLAN